MLHHTLCNEEKEHTHVIGVVSDRIRLAVNSMRACATDVASIAAAAVSGEVAAGDATNAFAAQRRGMT